MANNLTIGPSPEVCCTPDAVVVPPDVSVVIFAPPKATVDVPFHVDITVVAQRGPGSGIPNVTMVYEAPDGFEFTNTTVPGGYYSRVLAVVNCCCQLCHFSVKACAKAVTFQWLF